MPGTVDVRAAGVCYVRPDGAVLLLRRTDGGHYWAFPGGKIEAGETPADAAAREVQEETGWDAGVLQPWTRRIKAGVDYTTFLSRRPTEMPDPVLNEEHDLFQWVQPDQALADGGLHPGVKSALLRFNADELSLARLMRLGEITSPQGYRNLLLVALRITGTGASYRTQAGDKVLGEDGKQLRAENGKLVYTGEYAWRDPSLYLNDEFVQRCQGLPVIWEHPEETFLNSAEFGARVVGTIMLPFIDGDEVWGIAKIYDAEAAQFLATKKMSTSPAVAFRDALDDVELKAEDGKKIMIEGKPSLVDHLAICELGVWDKGGPAAGVSNPSLEGVTTMAEKTTEEKIMDSLDAMHKRMDGMEETSKKTCERMDAMEAGEKSRKDFEDEQKRKDAEAKAEEDKKAADAAAKADEDKKAADAAAATGDISKRLTGVEAAIAGLGANPADFVAAQTRADRAYQVHGDSAAPRWSHGESLTAYRKRLLMGQQKHSTAFKDVDITKDVGESMLANAEKVVYADSVTAAMNPGSGVQGLREIREADDAGRIIKTFVGDNKVTWGPWMQRKRTVAAFDVSAANR